MFAVEAVTHAPIDWACKPGSKRPFVCAYSVVRLVPEAYIDTLTGIAASATDDSRIIEVLVRPSTPGAPPA